MDRGWVQGWEGFKGRIKSGKKKLRKDGQKVGREVGYRLDKGVIDGWMKGG